MYQDQMLLAQKVYDRLERYGATATRLLYYNSKLGWKKAEEFILSNRHLSREEFSSKLAELLVEENNESR